MRLIDADELCIPSEEMISKMIIGSAPTVNAVPMSVIEDIKDEIKQVVYEEADEEKWSRGLHYALKIIDKHITKT